MYFIFSRCFGSLLWQIIYRAESFICGVCAALLTDLTFTVQEITSARKRAQLE